VHCPIIRLSVANDSMRTARFLHREPGQLESSVKEPALFMTKTFTQGRTIWTSRRGDVRCKDDVDVDERRNASVRLSFDTRHAALLTPFIAQVTN
jgi:hypothetical protein